MVSFLTSILNAGGKIYSPRFALFLHNDDNVDLTKRVVQILTHDEAQSLTDLPTFAEKLLLASPKSFWSTTIDKGWSWQ